MSNYQKYIAAQMRAGAKLQSSEGEGYKCWLVFPSGHTKTIRRDSAARFCEDQQRWLVFGELGGIRYRHVAQ